jgi:GPH family glycoside/pentoside/hexuronide:cation symporter
MEDSVDHNTPYPATGSAAATGAVASRLAWKPKLAYAGGGLTDYFFLNLDSVLIWPVLAVNLKMSTILLGIAMAVARAIGCLTDPVAGNISDNIQTRWGRRRPFVLLFGALGGIFIPLVWMPPGQSQLVLFWYTLLVWTLITILYSFFTVPYYALGYELTSDYDDRTRLFSWRGYVQILAAFAAAWVWWIVMRPNFHGAINGARYLSIGIGLLMILCAAWTFLGTREHVKFVRRPQLNVIVALKLALQDKPFVMIQAASLLMLIGVNWTSSLGIYLQVYYACQGNQQLASSLSGVGGSAVVIPSLIGMRLAAWISEKLGKRESVLLCIELTLLSVFSVIWILTPEHPYWVILNWIINGMTVPAIVMLFSSMTADVCDEDQLVTGRRREGIFSAVNSLITKIALITGTVLGGMMPALVGYTNTRSAPSAVELQHMKALLIFSQLVPIACAGAFIYFYPITRSRAQATQARLQAIAAPGAQ